MKFIYFSLIYVIFLSIGCRENNPLNLPSVSSPEQALQRLIEGNDRWVKSKMSHPNQSIERRNKLAKEGQKPFVTILTCSDSRVVPEFIFDQGIGDVFIIRVAGNYPDVVEMASIEYGAEHLHTPLIMVLGHTQCGAITATCQESKAIEHKETKEHKKEHKEQGSIPSLLEKLKPAVQKTKQEKPNLSSEQLIEATSLTNVLLAVEKIHQSPIIHELVAKKKVKVIASIYHLESGKVEIIPTMSDQH